VITIDASAFLSWLKSRYEKLDDGVERALLLSAEGAAAYAKQHGNFQNRSGALRASIRGELRGRHRAVTIADARHAFWIENGNKPTNDDFIRPKKGKFLRFVVNGQTVFAKKVRPLTPRKYMAQAREAAAPLFERLVQQATKDAFG
jgi:hypothetical protein